MTDGSGKSNGYTRPVSVPPASCAHAPETAEMSLAACVLFLAVICPNALLTPPRQVCRVSMPTPCTKACTLVLARDPLATASWLIVEAIEPCSESRWALVTAAANRVTATR